MRLFYIHMGQNNMTVDYSNPCQNLIKSRSACWMEDVNLIDPAIPIDHMVSEWFLSRSTKILDMADVMNSCWKFFKKMMFLWIFKVCGMLWLGDLYVQQFPNCQKKVDFFFLPSCQRTETPSSLKRFNNVGAGARVAACLPACP